MFGHGYVAGENAAKVIAAERDVAATLERHLQPLVSRPLSRCAIAYDAAMIVRVGRTQARALLWLRLYLIRKLGRRALPGTHNAIYHGLSASRAALNEAPWRWNSANKRNRWRRIRPRLSGLARLWWKATEPPWPHGRRRPPSELET
jgi:hypothetical protein